MKAKDQMAAMTAAGSGGSSPCHVDDGPDLEVKVVESVAHKQKDQGFDYAGSILKHPQLSHEEKHSLLWVLAQSPAFHSLIPHSIIDDGVHELPEWKHCSSSRWVH
jgi:hypothetical protein